MSYKRLFASKNNKISTFRFTVDTRNIVAGATNGSENPLQFIIPLGGVITSNNNNFIIRVSDGRPDVTFNKTNAGRIITFATAGIYEISLIGSSISIGFGATAVDKLKMIYLDQWGKTFKGIAADGFDGYTNLIVRFKESVKLSGTRRYFFRGIKGFDSTFNLALIDASEATALDGMFNGVQMPLTTVLSPFFKVVDNLITLYAGVDLSLVPKIEIISPSINNVNYLLSGTNFHGELIINAPVKVYQFLLNGVTNPPSVGKIDVRYVQGNGFNNTSLGSGAMSTANVNATLLGWANTYDWTGFAAVTRNVYFNAPSKYSNIPEVVAAKAFLESKGFIFNNLTIE